VVTGIASRSTVKDTIAVSEVGSPGSVRSTMEYVQQPVEDAEVLAFSQLEDGVG
jgi:hypothetical protein